MQSEQPVADGESGDERQDAESLKADWRGVLDADSLKAEWRGVRDAESLKADWRGC